MTSPFLPLGPAMSAAERQLLETEVRADAMQQKMLQQQEEIRLQKEETARLRAELATSRQLAGSAKEDAE